MVTSLPHLLRYADKDSMAHSRELRLPFLDRRVAEFALSLPPEQLYDNGTTKRVLREAVRAVVPADVLERREKVGFETPEARWFAEPATRERFAEILLDGGARTAALVDRAAVESDIAAQRWRAVAGIWRAVNAELWLRELARAGTRTSAALSGA
jgi:asparagine synthase (glutamine-hydrolysing)